MLPPTLATIDVGNGAQAGAGCGALRQFNRSPGFSVRFRFGRLSSRSGETCRRERRDRLLLPKPAATRSNRVEVCSC